MKMEKPMRPYNFKHLSDADKETYQQAYEAYRKYKKQINMKNYYEKKRDKQLEVVRLHYIDNKESIIQRKSERYFRLKPVRLFIKQLSAIDIN